MGNIRNQYLSTICVNLSVLSYGVAFGWCSPILPVLLSDDSPLITGPITIDESAWISSILCLGLTLGALLSGSMSAKLGRIRLLIVLTPLQIAGWLLVKFAQNVYYLYVSRCIMGFVGSALFVIVPVYVAEIADDSIRGSLGSILPLAFNFGIFLAFLVAATLHVSVVPFFGLIFTVACVVSLLFISETPQYLMTNKQFDKAEKSLTFYKGNEAILGKHVGGDPGTGVDEQKKSSRITLADLRDSVTRKGIIISMVLVPISQFCGIPVILCYMAQIFEEASISIDPNYASCIAGALQLLGSYICIILVERLGRKVLLTASSFGTGLFLIMMGVYDFLKTAMQIDVSAYNWVPLLSLSGVLFISATGLYLLPYVVSAEVLPQRIRASVMGNGTVIRAIVPFFYVQYYNWFLSTFNLYGTMWIYASCCWFCTVFILYMVPETKGKSFEDIRKSLQSKK